MTNEQCFKAWAAQSRFEGKEGNVSFEGPRLYSYRLPIAEIYPGVTFILSSGSTKTTDKHLRNARRHAPGTVIHCNSIGRPHTMLQEAAESINSAREQLLKGRANTDFLYCLYKAKYIEFLRALERLSVLPEVQNVAAPLPPPAVEGYFFHDLAAALKSERRNIKTKRPNLKHYAQYNLEYRNSAIREPITGLRLSIETTDEAEAWRSAADYLKQRTPADMGTRLAEILLEGKKP